LVITLGPLPETDVAALVTAMVGAPPGEALRRLTAQAAGNPLYVRELVDALVREQALQVRPVAEISGAQQQLPVSFEPRFLRLFQDENPQLRIVPFDADRVGETHGATTDDRNVVIQLDPYSLTHKNCRSHRSRNRAGRDHRGD
jgi:hypothetical protein